MQGALPAATRFPAVLPCRRSGNRGISTRAAPPSKGSQEGDSWYERTRPGLAPKGRTVREELEYRRAANQAANNGKERKDLYTDNWDGSEWKGQGFNILTLLGLLFVLVPAAGLWFAFATYGDLWG